MKMKMKTMIVALSAAMLGLAGGAAAQEPGTDCADLFPTSISFKTQTKVVKKVVKPPKQKGKPQARPTVEITTTTRVLNATLEVANFGTLPAPNSVVEFYLSDDDQLSTATDRRLHRQALGEVPPGAVVKRTLGGGLFGRAPVSGKHLIAVVDATGLVAECDETSNTLAEQIP